MFDEKLLHAIRTFMINHHDTLAVAESVTSGLLQAAFGSAQDASRFFQGGISAYNVGQKVRHLDVEPIHAIASNCVSQKIADEMALQVCKLFRSDWGISITGYAVPVSESDNKLFAYYAIAYKETVLKQRKLTAKEQDPSSVKIYYIDTILSDLSEILISRSVTNQNEHTNNQP